MIHLAAFLGNPGSGYAKNRHNAGRLLAGALPFYSSLSWQKKFKGLFVSFENSHFLMPETFMNLSGESVFAAASFYKIKVEEIIVVHDELELPLGTISLKFSGGLGGHNGLRSMKKSFGNADFWRLRIGIGRPDSRLPGEGGREGSGEGVYDWVLSDFSAGEQEKLASALSAGACLLSQMRNVDPKDLLPIWKKKTIIGLKVRFLGEGSAMTLTHGKIYDAIAIEHDSYRIIDDTYEDYLYPIKEFEIVSEPTETEQA